MAGGCGLNGQSRVTIVDIARAAGVSKSTVSLVLQGSPLVKPETRERVREAIQRLGYVYHRGAANLRSAASPTWSGMVINDLTNPFFAELAVGHRARRCRRPGLRPVPRQHRREPRRARREVMRTMREHGAVGLHPLPGASAPMPADLAEVEAWRLPRGHRDAPPAGRGCIAASRPTIGGGAERATEHLIAARAPADRLSRRAVPAWSCTRSARPAAERRLRRRACRSTRRWSSRCTPNRDGGAPACGRVLAAGGAADRGSRASTTWSPSACCYGLAERGLAAGRDFAVVGFDDVADARADPRRRSPPSRSTAAGSASAPRSILLQHDARGTAAARSTSPARPGSSSARPAARRGALNRESRLT